MSYRAFVATGVALVVTSSAFATNFTMTFDTDAAGNAITAGTVLTTQYAAWGVTVGIAPAPPAGVPLSGLGNGGWATNSDKTIVSSTGSDVGGLGTGTGAIAGNLLRSFNGWLSENNDPFLRFSFAGGIDSIAADFGGMADVASTRIFALVGNTVVGSVTASATTGRQHLSLSGVGTFDNIIITPGDYNDWVGVDNIAFNTVPGPASAGMLGMGAMMFARRRRA